MINRYNQTIHPSFHIHMNLGDRIGHWLKWATEQDYYLVNTRGGLLSAWFLWDDGRASTESAQTCFQWCVMTRCIKTEKRHVRSHKHLRKHANSSHTNARTDLIWSASKCSRTRSTLTRAAGPSFAPTPHCHNITCNGRVSLPGGFTEGLAFFSTPSRKKKARGVNFHSNLCGSWNACRYPNDI